MSRTTASARPFVAPSSPSLPLERLAFSIAARRALSREFFNSIGRFKTFGIDSRRRLRLITRLQSRFRFISRNFPLPTLLLRQHLILPTMLLHPTFGGTSWLRPARKALPSTPTVISPSTRNITAYGFAFDSGR